MLSSILAIVFALRLSRNSNRYAPTFHNRLCKTIDHSGQAMGELADYSNLHILRFWLKLITEMYSVSGSQDMELHSPRY